MFRVKLRSLPVAGSNSATWTLAESSASGRDQIRPSRAAMSRSIASKPQIGRVAPPESIIARLHGAKHARNPSIDLRTRGYDSVFILNRAGSDGPPNRPRTSKGSPPGSTSGLVPRTLATGAERQKRTIPWDCEKNHQLFAGHMLQNGTCESQINSFKTFLTHEPRQYIIMRRETLGPIREEMRIAGSEARFPTGGRAVSY